METLAEDLVTEILVRLPVKSLMRFKCVKQSWNALIRSRSFVTKHGSVFGYGSGSGSSSSPNEHERLIIFHDESLYSLKRCITLVGECDDEPPQRVEFPFADNKSLTHAFCYGPSNGIFCIYGYFQATHCQIVLWNPATREVKVVPPPPHRTSHDQFLKIDTPKNFLVHGFGVDPNTNDYKVVHLVMDDTKDVPYPTSVEVYNLSTNSWTIIHDTVPATNVTNSKYTTLANGVYHWLVGYPGNYTDMLCFDLRNNQFRKLKLPRSQHLQMRGHNNIAEVNDSIAYVESYFNPYRFEIWILDEFGVEGSWTKKYNFGPIDEDRYIYGIWKDGRELLGGEPGQPLVSYNSDFQPVRELQINVVNTWFRIRKYVESITPISV